MYQVAIVEDEHSYQEQIASFVIQYGEEKGMTYEITTYSDGADIVKVEKHYDIIFFDIEMEQLNGMDAAREIRKKDTNVVLVFITNMAQYAIEGYSVGALDFVLKPIDYYSFAFRMDRAMERVATQKKGELLLNTVDGVAKVTTDDIYYVEIANRMLHYFTKQGEIVLRGTMQAAEEQLRKYHFVKCNHWYLVNLKYVSRISENTVYVGEKSLEISRRNKSVFVKSVTDYFTMQN